MYDKGFGSKILVAHSELTPSEIQDLGDIIPQLLEIKNKANMPIKIHIQIELGDGERMPDKKIICTLNQLLSNVNEDLKFGH
jgi:hypothetical protein